MPRKILKSEPIPISQVKATLESLGKENLDQFQNRSLDYATKFSKIDPESSQKLLNELKKEEILEEEEAVQLVNCMPKSMEELRIFMAGGRRIVETPRLEAILSLLNKYRKE